MKPSFCRYQCGKLYQIESYFFQIFSFWRLNFFARFPFNTKCPAGYLVALLLQYTAVTYVFSVIVCLVSVGIGFFSVVVLLARELRHTVKAMNNNAKSKDKRNQVIKQLPDFIQTYSTSHQLSIKLSAICHCHNIFISIPNSLFYRVINNYLELYQPVYIVLYIFSIAAIGVAMLIVQMELVQYKMIYFFMEIYWISSKNDVDLLISRKNRSA